MITSDVMMPQFSGSAALALAKELRPGLHSSSSPAKLILIWLFH